MNKLKDITFLSKSHSGKEIKDVVNSIIGQMDMNDMDNPDNKSILTFNSHYLDFKTAKYPIRDTNTYYIDAKKSGNKLEYRLVRDRGQEHTPPNISLFELQTTNIPKQYDLDEYYRHRYNNPMCHTASYKLTEDDIICLDCGTIIDDSLSTVPNENYHISNFVCPCCGSTTSAIATWNKYVKMMNIYRR